MRAWRATAFIAVVLLLGTTTATSTPPADPGGPFRARAFNAYNLDYPQAVGSSTRRSPPIRTTRRRIALAATTWLHHFPTRLGDGDSISATSSAATSRSTNHPPRRASSRRIRQGTAARGANLAAHPDDVQACATWARSGHHDHAAPRWRAACWARSARRGVPSTRTSALALDPSRKDAGLIVGTCRYIVST
jgi:hypothetical protein